VAAPSSYHEFTGPEPLAYDGPGTDAGNEWKIKKKVEAYDEDATLSIDTLLNLDTCNGRVGATGTSPFSPIYHKSQTQSIDTN
jgi:dienelactone hydrolase